MFPSPVGEVSNLAGVECPINSKLYYNIAKIKVPACQCVEAISKPRCFSRFGGKSAESDYWTSADY